MSSRYFDPTRHRFFNLFKVSDMRVSWLPLAFASFAFISSCSSQQLYSAGQTWQRDECNKIVDAQDRKRCLDKAATSFDSYQHQSEEAKTSK
jgi:hypothetical protein